MTWLRALFYQGRHHLGPSDGFPTGQVWFRDGLWWTFDRLNAYRVPRRFEKRSNPLDNELRIEMAFGRPVRVFEVEYG